ncbi:MAG: glycosyltransferase family 2 protein [Ilumatobacter sp.]
MSQPLGHAAVCALTYRRPRGLERLLDGLDELEIPDGLRLDVVIVDNDADASARTAVEARAATSAFSLHYVHEPARGISTARNAAVAGGLELGADAICFIDDDEWPEADWLRQFIETAESTSADVVTGPVFPVFEETPPAWVLDGGFFDRRRHEHEERIRYATTSSVLIRSDALRRRTPPSDAAPFDLAFGLTGGEDTHLFAEMRTEGCALVWCDRAIVHELIPASKVNTSWLLRREYRRGQTLSLSMRRRTPGAWRVVRRIANATIEIGLGIPATLIGVVRGRAALMRGLHRVVFGVGMLTGLAGRSYAEYSTTHGS